MSDTLKEKLLGRINKNELVEILNNQPKQFELAVEFALSNEKSVSWRATWLLFHSIKKNDNRLKSYIPNFISSLKGKGDGHQREILKIILKFDINDDLEGVLFDECMNIWENIYKSPSVRFTAFRFIVITAKKYPELKNEIKFITQNHYVETLSQGFKQSFNRLKRELDF